VQISSSWSSPRLICTLGVIGVGMGRSKGQVQILEIIADDFIRDTNYSENKALWRKART